MILRSIFEPIYHDMSCTCLSPEEVLPKYFTILCDRSWVDLILSILFLSFSRGSVLNIQEHNFDHFAQCTQNNFQALFTAG